MKRFLPWMFAAFAALAAACTTAPAEPPAPAARQAVRVEVWHDTVCPWCRIGLHNLEQALASLEGTEVDVVHRAYLLEPNMPPEGADMRERLGRKFGPEQLDAMFQRVTQAGAQYGVRFDFAKITRSPATQGSHALIDWAPDAKRAQVIAAVHRAHFEEGRDIGDPAVLAAIAGSAGLDAAAAKAAVTDPTRLERIRNEAAAAAQAGVRGVPYFVIGDQVLRGAQPPEAIRQAIRAAATPLTPRSDP